MQSGSEQQKFGTPLADFSLSLLRGGTVSLSASLAGRKGAVVVFWSSNCSHCNRYDTYLNGFAERHPDLGLIVIAARAGETAESARKAATERKLRFPLAHDPGGVLAKQWFTQQTPRVFLLDANRSLLYRGAIDNYKLEADRDYVSYLDPAIDEFLSGKPISRPETASYGCAIQSVYYILPKAL